MDGWKKRNEHAGPVRLKVKQLCKEAVLPTRGTPGSGGLDLYSTVDACLRPGDIVGIPSGLAMEIPTGYCGLLMTRSSFGMRGVRIAAGANCVDADFRGELIIYLRNDGEYDWNICKGDRVAQLVIIPYLECVPVAANELTATLRGTGGFGSTGR